MTTLILGTGLPAPRDVVDAVYARTDGVPLHIEELCSALGRERLADSAAVLEAAVPETLEDATLARIGPALARRPGRRPGGRRHRPVVRPDRPRRRDEPAGRGARRPDPGACRPRRPRPAPSAAASSTSGTSCFATRCIDRCRPAIGGGSTPGRRSSAACSRARRTPTRRCISSGPGMTDGGVPRPPSRQRSRRCGCRPIARRSILFRRAVDNMPASLSDEERLRILLLFSDAAGNIDRNALMADFATRARELALRIGQPFAAIEALGQSRRPRRGAKGSPSPSGAISHAASSTRSSAAPPDPMRGRLPHPRAPSSSRSSRWTPAASREARALLAEAGELSCDARRRRARSGSTMPRAARHHRRTRGRGHWPPSGPIGETVRANGQEDTSVALLSRCRHVRDPGDGLPGGTRRARGGPPVRGIRRADVLRPHPAVMRGPHLVGGRAAGTTRSDRAARRSATPARAARTHGPVGARVRRGRAGPACARPRSTSCRRAAFGRRAERLDLLLPALWGLAEAALHAGDPEGAAHALR